MTYALMYGVPFPTEAPKDQTWNDHVHVHAKGKGKGKVVKYTEGLLTKLQPPQHLAVLDYDHGMKTLGVFVAKGAGEGYVDLRGPIDIAAIEKDERYRSSLEVAKTTWTWFHAAVLTFGMTLPDARLWLVETETG